MNYTALIESTAGKYALDPILISGQVMVESAGHSWAWNPEQKYRWFWNVKTNTPFRTVTDIEIGDEFAPKDFPCLRGDPDQEWWGQQASWGLMQIMGAVARERGFRRDYLTELCEPSINLELGCAHLAGLLRWAAGNIERALAAYNGGKSGNMVPPFRNQDYATKVLTAASKLRQ